MTQDKTPRLKALRPNPLREIVIAVEVDGEKYRLPLGEIKRRMAGVITELDHLAASDGPDATTTLTGRDAAAYEALTAMNAWTPEQKQRIWDEASMWMKRLYEDNRVIVEGLNRAMAVPEEAARRKRSESEAAKMNALIDSVAVSPNGKSSEPDELAEVRKMIDEVDR